MDDSFREALPFVFDLFGVPDAANPAPAIDADQRQKHLHGVVKRVFHDPAYSGGTRVMLLEDLHWFDGASDGFLETMVESAPATRDLLLVNFRSEYNASCMQDELVLSIHAGSLAPRDLEMRGRLAGSLGDTTASDRTRHEALDLYRDIGATGHVERLARELGV